MGAVNAAERIRETALAASLKFKLPARISRGMSRGKNIGVSKRPPNRQMAATLDGVQHGLHMCEQDTRCDAMGVCLSGSALLQNLSEWRINL